MKAALDAHCTPYGKANPETYAFIAGAKWQASHLQGKGQEDTQPCSVCGAAMNEIQKHTYNQSARYECPKCGQIDVFP